MAIDPPYRLDPFQNIVGVHWSELPTSTDQPYLYGRTGYQVIAGPHGGGPGEPRDILSIFASPSNSPSLPIGHCQIYFVSEVYPFPGDFLYDADGNWTGLPDYVQYTSSPPDGYVVIFDAFTDVGAVITTTYHFQNQSPPYDTLAGGSLTSNFTGASITLNGYVNYIPGTNILGTYFIPFLEGKTLSFDGVYQPGDMKLGPDLYP